MVRLVNAADPPSEPRARAGFEGDDAALVEAIWANEPGAIEALHDRYGSFVLRVLCRLLGTDRELMDVHHDVFVRALGSFGEIKSPSSLKSWLTSVTVFTARSAIQRRARGRWLSLVPREELPEVEAATASGEINEALRATYAILETFDPDERIAFALRFIDGMELTQVADACGVSLATIKRRLARAEDRFVATARRHPVLEDWLEGGARWGGTSPR